MKKIRITPAYISKLWGVKLTPYIESRIKKYSFTYEDLREQERDSVLKKVITTLLDPFLVFSGKHRLMQWEKGWEQNLNEYISIGKEKTIIPHYFGKYPVVRLNQEWIRPLSPSFEYNMLGLILDWVFDKYMRKARHIYEFGCGTGHNLIRLRDINPHAVLWGLDWTTSSQKLIDKYSKKNKDKHWYSHRFDYFNPDKNFKLSKDGIVYTVASLEQVGDKYKKFVRYLLKESPVLCIHIEPIAELLDEEKLIDYLSIEYFKKRKYLSEYLNYLRKLEKEGKVKIHEARRTYIGSMFIEGYSIIIWSPL